MFVLKEVILLSPVELFVVEIPAARSAQRAPWVCQPESRTTSWLLQCSQGCYLFSVWELPCKVFVAVLFIEVIKFDNVTSVVIMLCNVYC